MKKGLLFFIFWLAATNLYSQEWISESQQIPTAPKVKLISETDQATVLGFTLEGFYKEAVNTPMGSQYIIKVPDIRRRHLRRLQIL